jgi:hypothetical protein
VGLVSAAMLVVYVPLLGNQAFGVAQGAWVWTVRQGPPQFVPFAKAIVDPVVGRSRDGQPVVTSDNGEEVFDPRTRRFSPVTARQPLEAVSDAASDFAIRLTGASGEWLLIDRREHTTRIVTGAHLEGPGTAGPRLPDDQRPVFAMKLDGNRLVVARYDGSLLVADQGAFRAVPYDAGALGGEILAAGPGDGSHVAVIARTPFGGADGWRLRTHFIDVDTGAVSEGPPLPGAAASAAIASPRGDVTFDDGTLVVAATPYGQGTTAVHTELLPWVATALTLLLVVLVGVSLGFLRGALQRPAVWGLGGGGVLGAVIFLWGLLQAIGQRR